MQEINSDRINTFLNGWDPMEHIIAVECNYQDDKVSLIYVNENGRKMVKQEPFLPFIWVKKSAARRMFGGDRSAIRRKMMSYGINVTALITKMEGQEGLQRIEDGYTLMFYAYKQMSYTKFLKFFNESGVPVFGRKNKNDAREKDKEYLSVTPVEQYLMRSGRRLFKGYDGYDELNRMLFDIETTGLNPKVDSIEQIGVRTNKGFEEIIKVGDGVSEMDAIKRFLRCINECKPDVIAGHNSENFDWDFIITRSEINGVDFMMLSRNIVGKPIYKKSKESTLKLGGETEYFKPTILWGYNMLDSLHAVRRAQAIDSSMESANLKYVTKYLNLNKPNRVYVPGNKITTIWNDKEMAYAFNDTNGDWFRIDIDHPLKDGYVITNGEYIVKRYLLDDIWETDKVEATLNETNFLVSKLIPTSFQRACTMGTAGIWKLIILSWCFENSLAVPSFAERKRFTGGLSRLLKTGYVDRIVKLDFNSLYPSIILTWNVSTPVDITNAMLKMLEYILTQRETHKELKKQMGKNADKIGELLNNKDLTEEQIEELKTKRFEFKAKKSSSDKKQLQMKVLANSFFGSYGAPNLFPLGDVIAAEKTTCIGRMSLRLMISHFTSLGYKPIVGDSFTGDTPLFIKYDDTGLIDIKPISELIGETKTDTLGREYDATIKPYKVLCRSGWVKPDYIYRHKTVKPFYTVSEGDMNVTVTEDHSLFDDTQQKIKPSEITTNTRLEYYKEPIIHNITTIDTTKAKLMGKMLKNGTIDRIPTEILNADNKDAITCFLKEIETLYTTLSTKTCVAGIMFLKKKF